MSKVTETRVKITLTDAMSGPLRGLQGQLNSTNTAVRCSARVLAFINLWKPMLLVWPVFFLQ